MEVEVIDLGLEVLDLVRQIGVLRRSVVQTGVGRVEVLLGGREFGGENVEISLRRGHLRVELVALFRYPFGVAALLFESLMTHPPRRCG